MTESQTGNRHMLIAGIGRAGTSFLVNYLHELGLDTHMSRTEKVQWSEEANAGFEDLPLVGDPEGLPYVIKSPWMGTYIDQLLASQHIKIDVMLIPTRDLRDAAASRLILEVQRIYHSSDWMTYFEETWDEWGFTPGGGIYSLDPVDLERLLAVKFAHLVQRVTAADIPMVFLDFPRIVEDPEYLFRKLQPYLPQGLTWEAATEVHRKVADADRVRVSRERSAASNIEQPDVPADAAAANLANPIEPKADARRRAFEEIDLIALRRQIAREKQGLRDLLAQHDRARETLVDLRKTEDGARSQLAELQTQVTALQAELGRLARKNQRHWLRRWLRELGRKRN